MLSPQTFFPKLLFSRAVNFAKPQQPSIHLLHKDWFSQLNQFFPYHHNSSSSGIPHTSLKAAHQYPDGPWRSKTSECRQTVVFLCPSASQSWALQHVVVVSLGLSEACFCSSLTRSLRQSSLGVLSCARTVTAPCCLCLHLAALLLLFLHLLWSSLTPNWTPSRVKTKAQLSECSVSLESLEGSGGVG